MVVLQPTHFYACMKALRRFVISQYVGSMLVVALHMQVAQKQEAEELKESGLEGKDAFGELVKLSSNGNSSGTNANGANHRNDPREDLERLYKDAAEGIVVAGREATWEATRPMVLPAGESQKLRGFIDYRRYAPSLLCCSSKPEATHASVHLIQDRTSAKLGDHLTVSPPRRLGLPDVAEHGTVGHGLAFQQVAVSSCRCCDEFHMP